MEPVTGRSLSTWELPALTLRGSRRGRGGTTTPWGVALRLLDQSARAWQHDEPLALRLTGDAVLIGPSAVLAILELQGLCKLPACGTAHRERLVSLAEEGQAAIGTVLLIGDRRCVR